MSVAVHAKTEYTYGTDAHGVTRPLAYDRVPALYTGDFGDCLGGQSLFNITKFDAGYYADNLTIVFHLDGASNIKNESLMMHISVDAYGSGRFDMTFDPCYLNLYSLCPLNASVPITGWAVLPVGPEQIGGIPPMAFSIPDFEGTARLRIFANSSETEIGCFQAGMRNGNTFSHPEIVAPVLGGLTLVAIIASFATAVYGVSVVHIRMHYAHSLSAFVLLETLQSIFFTGALTVNWPSVCVAWWSNFAWASGLIYVPAMVRTVNSFAGVAGNASQVGGAGSVILNTGGGLLTQIYGRSLGGHSSEDAHVTTSIAKRAPYNASNPFDYTWAGKPVMPGMPLPGTRSGLPGTLSGINIPANDAFIISLIWIMSAIVLTAVSIPVLKLSLELLARTRRVKEDRLSYFRSHWIGYMGHASLRAFFTSFFSVAAMAMYQFTLPAPSVGVASISAATFVVFVLGAVSLIAVACYARIRHGRFESCPDGIVFHRSIFLGAIPILIPACRSTLEERNLEVRPVITVSTRRLRHINTDPTKETVHADQGYVKKFGWFSGRYRRTRWWFLACYVFYLIGRASFLGAAALSPLVQVYGLLIFEICAFSIMIILNPFEGARNTALGVWMLGSSKILTTGLSIAFLPAFKLDRIIATVIGIVIIIIQGLLVIGIAILVALSVISTWMSLTRNQEEMGAEYLEGIRVKYFEAIEEKALDIYRAPQPKKDKKGKAKDENESPTPTLEPKFSIVSFRREPKIEDEDDEDEQDTLHDLQPAHNGGKDSEASKPHGVTRVSRTNSVSSQRSVSSLPRGLRAHQSAWSPKDGHPDDALDRPDSSLARRLAEQSDPPGTVAESSRSPTPAGEGVKRAGSRQSLRTLSGRANSPFSPGLNTPSRETLAKYADERRYPTPQPTIPDLE
ncbi:TRP-domain-containing protein [Podospora aff. communis PSN243]|uniref:TRP-domain-containing protein n=1 Tax=Podospora aff. communis PSN243 TaxID=3040156 RepID=A0AAV9GWS0_9PEZI|nr:TRP-domain-containing protein [Podospora aff. communis PSN243]